MDKNMKQYLDKAEVLMTRILDMQDEFAKRANRPDAKENKKQPKRRGIRAIRGTWVRHPLPYRHFLQVHRCKLQFHPFTNSA